MMSIFKISNTTLYKLKWYIMIPQKTEVIHTIKGIVVQRGMSVLHNSFLTRKMIKIKQLWPPQQCYKRQFYSLAICWPTMGADCMFSQIFELRLFSVHQYWLEIVNIYWRLLEELCLDLHAHWHIYVPANWKRK